MAEHIRPIETKRIRLHPAKAAASGATPVPKFARKSGKTGVTVASSRPTKSEASCRGLLESIYDAVLIATSSGDIFGVNPRAMEFFLRSRAELCGMNILDIISGADNSTLTAIVENLKDRKYALVSATCRRRDGSGFPAEIAISRITWDGCDQLCCTVRDLTVRKQAEKALKEALERLEERDRARLLLVSNVSHELRTPVTSMAYGIANVLRGTSGPVPENLKPYLERFQRDCRRLLTTANEILDLSALESQTMKLARVKVPVRRIVARSVELIELNAIQKNVELTAELSESTGFICCDPSKMERVILNIVSNAVKYTPGGGMVKVAVRRHPEQYKAVTVTVTDTGVGIPASAISRIGERYYRVGAQADGAGLGLAISKEIIAMHGGTLEIVSPPPGAVQGTQVTLTLNQTEPVRVLAAAGDDTLVAVLRKQLEPWEFELDQAADLSRLAECVGAKKPDIIVMDLAFGGTPGAVAIQSARASPLTGPIPLVAASLVAPDKSTKDVLKEFSIPLVSETWSEFSLLDAIAGALVARVDLDTKGNILTKGEAGK